MELISNKKAVSAQAVLHQNLENVMKIRGSLMQNRL
jgi:hypothetical protein